MKKIHLFVTVSLMILLLGGCQSTSNSGSGNSPEPANDQTKSTPQENNNSPASTSYTMKELTSMVEDFVNTTEENTPDGASSDLEQFFSLKRESNQLEQYLDVYEDELEQHYRNGTITRDDYRHQERALDALEDRLDDCMDRLENTFGIID